MIRLTLLVIFGAAVFAAVTHLSVWLFLVPLAALVIYGYTFGGLRTKCPACRKRVKVGASACHHCGRDVRATAGV